MCGGKRKYDFIVLPILKVVAKIQCNFEMEILRAARPTRTVSTLVVRFIFELIVLGAVLIYLLHDNRCYEGLTEVHLQLLTSSSVQRMSDIIPISCC